MPDVAPHWKRALREEFGGFSFRRYILRVLEKLIPSGMGGRLRARLYRRLGCQVGLGTVFSGPITFGDSSHLGNFRVGGNCFINNPVFIDAAAPVTLSHCVSLGHHVVIITSDHVLGTSEFRAGTVRTAPVLIEYGAWIAAGVMILPGVTIGAGAIVAAGAVVTSDIPPNTLVGGIPAKVIRVLDNPPQENAGDHEKLIAIHGNVEP